MSLDNALRTALLREGEGIGADPVAALPEIARRSRSLRRRRAVVAGIAATALAAAAWWLPELPPAAVDVDLPPAKRLQLPVDEDGRVALPPRRSAPRGAEQVAGPRPVATRKAGSAPRVRRSARGSAVRPSAGRSASGSGAAPATAALAARSLSERYEVRYVAGTHVGESAGTGCGQGESATGSNDCVAIQIGAGETSIEIGLVDDAGALVGATVYQHAGGEGSELVSFCGETRRPVPVEPGALLLVYVDTSARCSDESPRTGTLFATIR